MAPSSKRARQNEDEGDDQSSSKLPWLLGALGLLAALSVCIWFFYFRSPGGAEVSGTVTLEGAPLAGASIVFVLQDKSETVVMAKSDEQGEYRLVGNAGKQINVGAYKVAVSKYALRDGTIPVGEKLEIAKANGKLFNYVPAIYEEHASTPLQFDVKSGRNVIPIELKKKPEKK
jgi:hypothetical protein